MIMINTGYGKGKTTALIGQCVRSRGRGWKVLFVQFMKSWNSAELPILAQIGVDVVNLEVAHRPFTWDLTPEGMERLKDITQSTLSMALIMARKQQYDLIAIDEAGSAIKYNMATLDEIMVLANLGKHAFMTGHEMDSEWLTKVDYHTDMVPHRHPYHDSGKLAIEGIEF